MAGPEEGNRNRMVVECKGCNFRKLVDEKVDRRPNEIVVRHGRATGHTLSVSRLDLDQKSTGTATADYRAIHRSEGGQLASDNQ